MSKKQKALVFTQEVNALECMRKTVATFLDTEQFTTQLIIPSSPEEIGMRQDHGHDNMATIVFKDKRCELKVTPCHRETGEDGFFISHRITDEFEVPKPNTFEHVMVELGVNRLEERESALLAFLHGSLLQNTKAGVA